MKTNRKTDATRNYAKNVLGVPYSSDKKNINGMDDIDRWAEGVGRSEKNHRMMTPRKRHVYSV